MSLYKNILKPILDWVTALVMILLLLPVFVFLTILLIFNNNGRPFFFQVRPGKNAKLFKIIKFKTMTDKRDINGNLLPDDKRLTKLGAFIRKTSLDEIPQLINVILGHMSLVGPRPLLPEYLELYSAEHRKRHHVIPGITGWAQVNGRNAISWKRKLDFDVYYVNNQSFYLDLRILFLTVKKVFISEGITNSEGITMNRFEGYQ